MEYDWQSSKDIKERGYFMFKAGIWSDCSFAVGVQSNRSIISAHKIILASASPVFASMFFGTLQEKADPIAVTDVDPDAFQAMIEYIYSDTVNFTTLEKACELYYVASKYILPRLVVDCSNFILKALGPNNACRAYELGKLFDNSDIIEESMNIIINKTLDVISAPNFNDITFDTLMMILEQDKLTINTELDLIKCLLKYAYKHDLFSHRVKSESLSLSLPLPVQPQELKHPEKRNGSSQDEAAEIFEDVEQIAVPILESNVYGRKAETPDESSGMTLGSDYKDDTLLRQAVKKLRFLSLTPQQFSRGAARSKLLQPFEAFTLMLKITDPHNIDPMPKGFSSTRTSRNPLITPSNSSGVTMTCQYGHKFKKSTPYYFCSQCQIYCS